MSTVHFDRDQQASWYAKEHLKTDPGIDQVIYLPTGAGPREIRFLEINTQVGETSAEEPLVAINFGVDRGQETEHSLLVVDATPNQWQRVLDGELELPAEWSLKSIESFPNE